MAAVDESLNERPAHDAAGHPDPLVVLVMAMLANTLTTEAQSLPYSAKLPLADFEGIDAQGNPQPIT